MMLELIRRHNAVQNGDRLLEVGTGWIHWEATYIRLFYDTDTTLFDVWDNRQLKPLKRYYAELDRIIDHEVRMTPAQSENVHRLLKTISSTNSFDDLYSRLNYRYIVEPSGKLHDLPDESFNVIVSCDVLEHVDKGILSEYIQDFYRLLKPGGYSIHTIDIGDHISYYDPSVSVKNYLRYSDKVWKRCFENKVQYFNRIQRSTWLDLFQKAGLRQVAEESVYRNVGIKPNREYQDLSREDIECTVLKVVHRKPLQR
jgi:SAM-dependent methyltransferase